ncbi:MAG: hypothetical protein WAN89_00045 [Lawsonella sp.]
MTSLPKAPFKTIIAAAIVMSLVGFSACANDVEDASPEAQETSVRVEKPASPSTTTAPTSKNQAPLRSAKKPKKKIDWQAVLEDPAQYLLSAAAFPEPYQPRTLNLSERGKAIQDVGRAGVGVSNFPCECDGAGGRIGNEEDQLAMQMAAHGNNSLTLVVINTQNPQQAVANWGTKNNQCSSFLSKENGVTSKVYITPLDVTERAGRKVVGYKITTVTKNLVGSMQQEQILFAVPLGNVVIEVMGMSFNEEANEVETLKLLDLALERAQKIEDKKLSVEELANKNK